MTGSQVSAELREFSGSTIDTPFEKMRANAILNASHDAKGFSIINFNVSGFLKSAKHNDIIYILCLWAIEPVNKAPSKFEQHPQAGQQALIKRASLLADNLSQRRDLNDDFLQKLRIHMERTIENHMIAFLSNVQEAQSA